MQIVRTSRALAIAVTLAVAPAFSQTVQPRITVGTNPVALAANPVTGKVYVANSGSNNVTIIDGVTRTTMGTIPVGSDPHWIAVNPETNRVLVSNFATSNVTVVNGATDTPISTLGTGGSGWIAINAISNISYVIRYGSGDEYNHIQGDAYIGTQATRSYQPVSIAVNPVTNRVYVANKATTDITATAGSPFTFYPPLFCPDGAGGFKPQPPDPPGADPGACIDVANLPVAVAVNPVTNKIYGISTAAISVILGSNHTFTTLVPPGGLTDGKTIAVNPVSNKIYAVFGNGVVVVNGSDNTMTAIPAVSGTAVAIGINVVTNKVYVAKNNGTMMVIDGATNAASTITGLAVNSNAIAVDPVANVVYVSDPAGGVTPVTGVVGEPTVATGITTTITPLAGNTGGSSGTITLGSTSAMTPSPLNTVRKAYFRIDGGGWIAATPAGSGTWTAPYSGLAAGSHTIEAFGTNGLDAPALNTDLANVPIVGNVASYGFSVASATAPAISVSPTSLDFGGQSMATTSPPKPVTITNTGTATLTVSGIAASAQFSQTNNCGALAPAASCTVQVSFTPAINSGAALNSSTAVTGSLTITSDAPTSPSTVSLAGNAEKSLVTHYYRSILRRAPDSGGLAFWQAEAARVVNKGANVNEAWYALAMTFFASGEYAATPKTNDAFVTDLYMTFFNRQPDADGLAYWSGQLSAGLPREVALAAFMFSPEFSAFSQAIFGNASVRAEVNMAGDFFRGLLGRLPDNGGFDFWVGRFRTAQCQSTPSNGAPVYAEVESMSSAFATSAEYSARGRTNAQYVGDLYNAFLRRGGDLNGVQFWINQLNGGSLTREQVRQAFVGSPEFNSRVQAVVNQGCFTS